MPRHPQPLRLRLLPKVGDALHTVDVAGLDKVLWVLDYGVTGWRTLGERLDDVMLAWFGSATIEKTL